ncbi:DUF4189 domain-containing protein [Pseudomonas sp. F1_0610]|uniref:DUF4189 domain-containing protein n=1 Tax=Pseudomonas sp. F1_0610 TaxID=3114284 RepID=UPI0039C44E2E
MKFFRNMLLVSCFLFVSNNAFSQTYWGAVYIDLNTGIFGGAYDAQSEYYAKDTALKSCQNKHSGKKNNCELLITFYNGCVSVYWAPNKKAGWGFNSVDAYSARVHAVQRCANSGGKECSEVLFLCTTRYY